MKYSHLRHIQNVLARRERKPSVLHAQIALIKLAYEGGLGVPTICKILEDAGVAEGISVPNVQGFIRRQRKLGTIGEKGSTKEAFNRGIEQAAKLPAVSGTQPPPSPEPAADLKTAGSSCAAKSHPSLPESLSSLSTSTNQAPPPAPDENDPVTKLRAALKKKKS